MIETPQQLNDLVILRTLKKNPKALLHLTSFEEMVRLLLIVSHYDDELYLDLYTMLCGWASVSFINHCLWSEHDNFITKN